MRDPAIEARMLEEAKALIRKRYPAGWGGAAVIRTDKDHYLTSVALDTFNASCELCIEVGAMCEASKLNERVTHCLCVVREDESAPFQVLSPCGICQERLRYWGEQVQVGVTTQDNSLLFVDLKELQPYHWTHAYPADELEHYEEPKGSRRF